jgi:hypothetical protein
MKSCCPVRTAKDWMNWQHPCRDAPAGTPVSTIELFSHLNCEGPTHFMEAFSRFDTVCDRIEPRMLSWQNIRDSYNAVVSDSG